MKKRLIVILAAVAIAGSILLVHVMTGRNIPPAPTGLRVTAVE